MYNSCESDDLYQSFNEEQQKFNNMFGNKAAVPIKIDKLDRRDAPYGVVDGDEDDEGGENQDENFRLLYNHMQAYREKNRLNGDNGNSGEYFHLKRFSYSI